jgi:hypothetical protein
MVPQIIYLVLNIVGLLILIRKHGQPEEGKHNFWRSFVVAVLLNYLLYTGGFYAPLFK